MVETLFDAQLLLVLLVTLLLLPLLLQDLLALLWLLLLWDVVLLSAAQHWCDVLLGELVIDYLPALLADHSDQHDLLE